MEKIENNTDFKVYYADTDSYGMVWHGSYLRWFEAGRIEFLNQFGIDIDKIRQEKNIVLPVHSIKVNYKTSAKYGDEITTLTSVEEIKPHYVVFNQIIKEKNSDKIFAIASVKCVGVNNEGKLIRYIDKLFEKC